MTTRSVCHATFSIERTYDASPARVYAAFADPELKSRWFGGPPEWTRAEHVMDFRVGGRELERGGPPDGPEHRFDARYHEIVPNERIVFAYDMYVGDAQLSVSLSTVELAPEGDRTRLVFTEQGAFFDGHEDPALREEGFRELLEAIAPVVEHQAIGHL